MKCDMVCTTHHLMCKGDHGVVAEHAHINGNILCSWESVDKMGYTAAAKHGIREIA